MRHRDKCPAARIGGKAEDCKCTRICWDCCALVHDQTAPCICGAGPEYSDGARLVSDACDAMATATAKMARLRLWAEKKNLIATASMARTIGKTHAANQEVVEAMRQLLSNEGRAVIDAGKAKLTVIKGGNA